jgi:hypothetical protein
MAAKKIIVCCDGTWNKSEDRTNITWFNANIVGDGGNQIIYYDTGVGTHWYDEKTGGVLGAGLSRNVREAYQFILENYQPGDEIYCFGFSRGAFTVRSLCGFMGQVGRLASVDDISEAYFFYRINEPDDEPNAFERLFQPKMAGPMSVRFLGVFDTVGSLGIPLEIADKAGDMEGKSIIGRAKGFLLGWADDIGDRLRRPIKGFHDMTLGSIVEEARHAMAIDENRAMFVPTLWTQRPGQATRVEVDGQITNVDQKVEQVWFAGVHSDVGGGYDDPEWLANIPLLWMAEKAAAAGLIFKDGALAALRQDQNSMAPQHDSMTKVWKTLHEKLKIDPVRRPRTNASRRQVNPGGDVFPLVDTDESIHPAVLERTGQTVKVVDENGDAKQVAYQLDNRSD